MNEPHSRRGFLRITTVGAGQTGAGAGAGSVRRGHLGPDRPDPPRRPAQPGRPRPDRRQGGRGTEPWLSGYQLFAADESGPHPLPPDLDATLLSDEHADEFHQGQLRVPGFTGAMPGLWRQDLEGAGVHTYFAYSAHREGRA